ncbi:hypothetical protein DSL92_01570 [Billgrantia gudaonensis]|uniref:Uncharacterized protein n=1 Tax=Billgrantia gudaonensis TaxID=376427 RepID=A0A3S0NHR5_9GAMM|nr:hypothetical protein DSL92_01570 [Halomonas gudaonensis]
MVNHYWPRSCWLNHLLDSSEARAQTPQDFQPSRNQHRRRPPWWRALGFTDAGVLYYHKDASSYGTSPSRPRPGRRFHRDRCRFRPPRRRPATTRCGDFVFQGPLAYEDSPPMPWSGRPVTAGSTLVDGTAGDHQRPGRRSS